MKRFVTMLLTQMLTVSMGLGMETKAPSRKNSADPAAMTAARLMGVCFIGNLPEKWYDLQGYHTPSREKCQ